MTDAWRAFRPVEALMADVAVPDNPVVITICVSLARNVPLPWLQHHLIARMLRHPRFAAVASTNPRGAPRFNPVPDFTPTSPDLVAHHVAVEPPPPPALPPSARERAFSDRVAALMSQPLDMARPLWKLFLFPRWSLAPADPGPDDHDDACTVVLRVHHAIADGIGLVKFFSAELIDRGPEHHLPRFLVVPDRQRAALRAPPPPPAPSASLKQPVLTARKPGLLQRAWETLEDVYLSSVRMLFPQPDSVFTRSAIQPDKVCALLPPSRFTMDMLKDASRILGVTINDLLYTALSGAARAYLRESGDDPDALGNMRCAMPFNRHMLSEFKMSDISNQFALVVPTLHVDEADRLTRLKRCFETLLRVKRSHQFSLLLGLVDVVARLPRLPRNILWRHLTKAASVLFTNVPGPRQVVQLGGVDVSTLHFFAPSDGHAGVVISLISYAGKIAIGVSGDKGRMSNPQRFVELLTQEIEELIQLSKEV